MSDIKYIEGNDVIDQSSRYQGLRVYLDDDNNPVLETVDFPNIEDKEDDIFFEVKPEHKHRPDLITDDLYNNDQMYWLLAISNDMVDPIAETYTGLKVRLPSNDRRLEILENLNNEE